MTATSLLPEIDVKQRTKACRFCGAAQARRVPPRHIGSQRGVRGAWPRAGRARCDQPTVPPPPPRRQCGSGGTPPGRGMRGAMVRWCPRRQGCAGVALSAATGPSGCLCRRISPRCTPARGGRPSARPYCDAVPAGAAIGLGQAERLGLEIPRPVRRPRHQRRRPAGRQPEAPRPARERVLARARL